MSIMFGNQEWIAFIRKPIVVPAIVISVIAFSLSVVGIVVLIGLFHQFRWERRDRRRVLEARLAIVKAVEETIKEDIKGQWGDRETDKKEL